MLHGAPTSAAQVYDPDVHPKGIVDYFTEAYERIGDAIENMNDRGDLKFVAEPVRPPTLAGYAARIGVARETLWAWALKHSEFGEAVDVCKAVQEAFLVEQGTLGALNPQMTMFALKNLQGWREKADVSHSGKVELRFDDQDEEA